MVEVGSWRHLGKRWGPCGRGLRQTGGPEGALGGEGRRGKASGVLIQATVDVWGGLREEQGQGQVWRLRGGQKMEGSGGLGRPKEV